ncbi:MAG: hypothetical protein JSW40_01740 [Candidatus Omnitrophota bacterium]|nr:MAG: hypothetical protein JSW40_01740 [Candidatus Omnitrophota bacterium]
MDKHYSFQDDGSFIVRDYNRAFAFSNFLPGIAGAWGVPMWAFYVNRAQGIISFGIQDKNHSIAEFFPASKAYWLVSSCGFRTFLKVNKQIYYEPFRLPSGHKKTEEMIAKSASLIIRETNHHLGLSFSVKYFTLPQSSVGALVRVLSIKNDSSKKTRLEILDGLPRLIPFGSNNLFLKDLARTLEAWMHSCVSDNVALFRLIVNPKDTSHTKYVEGANFNCAFYEEKGKVVFPYLVVDPEVIFGEDKAYSAALNFFHKDFRTPLAQVKCGKTPCSFSHFSWNLKPGQQKVFYSIFGASFKSQIIKRFVTSLSPQFIREKERQNEEWIERIKNNALCVSNSRALNHYIAGTYLDNVLRGGYPFTFDKKHIYYIFSRKHGDLERDYNKFKLHPSYFSEGEANYRDINQNRRMDLFFNPFIEKDNIVYFLNLLKLNGYNPLTVKGEKLFFKESDASSILKTFNIHNRALLSLMERGFYLGEFFKFLKEEGIRVRHREKLARIILERSAREPQARFSEGYWIDHWRYNLDLIESFLYFYPDKAKDLLRTKLFTFWDDEVRVLPRRLKYYKERGHIYQGASVERVEAKEEIVRKRRRFKNFLRTKRGVIYRTHLIEKLLVLILNKSASLDPHGVGIEMEAGKPGWCDSLNGLPALFGSSLCETLELERACLFLLDCLKKLKEDGLKSINFCTEVSRFFNRLDRLLKKYFSSGVTKADYTWWQKANVIKEDFRKSTFFSVEGTHRKVGIEKIESFLQKLVYRLAKATEKAKERKSNLYFTYFTYEVTRYQQKKSHIIPKRFKRHALPLFLEAPVHMVRVRKRKDIYYSLKRSSLYDRTLKMYRLNASLENEPLEIGRSRVFAPGWLENESIWLHMEYKYLLEVLKSGLYTEFFRDFYNTCTCFFDPHIYGRSTLENSSFIVSSVYPDKSLWGKGFVARLSGATAELLNIWIILCLGQEPFFVDENNNLHFRLSPILEGKMFTSKREKILFKGKETILEKNTFAFKLFSSILVVYHNPKRKDTFKDCAAKTIVVEQDGARHIIDSVVIRPPLSLQIRQAKPDRIDVYLE